MNKHDAAKTPTSSPQSAWRPPCAPLLPAQAHRPIAASLRLFADAENFPILVHCVHGKDRTGLIAMLLLGLLDVDKQACSPDPLLCPSRHFRVANATGTVKLCLETTDEVCQV